MRVVWVAQYMCLQSRAVCGPCRSHGRWPQCDLHHTMYTGSTACQWWYDDGSRKCTPDLQSEVSCYRIWRPFKAELLYMYFQGICFLHDKLWSNGHQHFGRNRLCYNRVSEWLSLTAFLGTADIGVHVAHTSCVIIAYICYNRTIPYWQHCIYGSFSFFQNIQSLSQGGLHLFRWLNAKET